MKEKRGELLWAVLTLIRAWVAAGKPIATVPAFGSFEQWSPVVGGILAHAGIEGFLENLDSAISAAGPEDQQWEAFLLEVYGQFPTGFTVAEVCAFINQKCNHTDIEKRETVLRLPPLRDLVPDGIADYLSRIDSFRKRLGQAFSARENKRHGSSGVHVTKVVEASGKQKTKQGSIVWVVRIP